MDKNFKQQYVEILHSYLKEQKEDHLYAVGQLGKWMLEDFLPPEEIVGFHLAGLKEWIEDLPVDVNLSFDVLIEIMVRYGIAYREHEMLVTRQQELESEIEVAVGMQQTLLPDGAPDFPGLDIGTISVPAHRMSGDYYNFVLHEDGTLGVALSDIIGKGIPAALCMSMIKYAMDGLDEESPSPSEILRHINAVVERNVDSSMFITMVYGLYNEQTHRFRYATAGHEPGFYYCAAEKRFYDMTTRGLVLGVSRHVHYQEYSLDLAPGDAIILFSDGVTECRIDEQFLGRDRLREILENHLDSTAQETVDATFQYLYEKANYELRDDQTILMLRRL
ncbi:PP2C family protein-serine/threonine phosphatase [Mechercharimyces sp. CAU 1602]|uniref:PP2C family protein-serine/threonine phosphatase n=1 Tax=Mechercharimyces sp. CAU 1602 TaxID=2973933 RepID=UPI0021639531|nr:PP2C family protein-serine/threonine phosphatase [Mechercharimyces sp. CAU 1602]MCS1352138.1 PP2C family protein-serine/threonine phosphatase [Mechercharimyces sp. CAU 1602]